MIEEFSTKQIGVICGGFSREREISIRSGKNIYNALQVLGYKAILIDFASSQGINKQCDIAFNALHGLDGENGVLQVLLEKQQVPYTGCGLEPSLIGFNKFLTKQICTLNDIPVAKSERCYTGIEMLPKQFIFPVVLKPLSEGSSIDVFIVDNTDQLQEKSAYLGQKYSEFLLEEFIQGKEVTVGIIDNPDPMVLPILELKPKNRFYDFEAKYTKGLTEFILPSTLNAQEVDQVEALALKLYKKTYCKGMARVDFLICPDRGPFALELNTIPGMTDTSDLPAQAKTAGIEFNSLIEIILKSALKRLQ
tara:strand:- start:1229 stop:2149 length:921 start_codon:yes stop_codon:yes gene_type:complete